MNKEMAGLLWNHKRAYINMEWQQDERYRNIRLEDCITSHWSLYTIEYNPSEPPDLRFSDYTIYTGKSAGVFLPELRVNSE